MTLRFDAGFLGKAQVTPQGFRRVPARVARTGVLKYRNPDGSERLELVPAEELFHADSLATLRSAPVTIGHQAMVNPKNVRALQVGIVENPRQDGQFLACDILIQDEEAIRRVDAGELAECSLGYELDFDETPGRTDAGPHHGVQRRRVYNHDALLPRGGGRAGREVALRFDSAAAVCDDACYDPQVKGNRTDETPEKPLMKFRFDGKEYDTAEAALAVADSQLQSARKDATEAKAKAEREEARADGLTTELAKANDPKRVQALVTARVALDSNAKAVLGSDYDPNGKAEREVMIDVIRADDAEFTGKDSAGKDRSSDYILGRFEDAVKRAPRADGVPALGAALRKVRKDGASEDEELREDGIPDTDEAQERSRNDAANAWRKPSLGAAKGKN